MTQTIEVKVPDIGDFKEVEVIEVIVKPGDRIAAEASLITVESDKATMEIPSPAAGVVREVRVKVGAKVSEGSTILVLEASEADSPTPASHCRTETREACACSAGGEAGAGGCGIRRQGGLRV